MISLSDHISCESKKIITQILFAHTKMNKLRVQLSFLRRISASEFMAGRRSVAPRRNRQIILEKEKKEKKRRKNKKKKKPDTFLHTTRK